MPRTSILTNRRALFLIPLAAFFAILPLIVHGGSCGHDEVFHVQGWFDAAAQLRHLHYPHWSFTSAWSAGEPRFLFYPPLSWLLGALLTLIFPPQVAVFAFIFLCLTLSGFTMYRLAAHFTSPSAALLAAVLYLANPYMLFNAFERTAFAELLAAAWIPLLLLAVLRRRPTIPSAAIPLALLWLTNAPAAVMASYAFALLAALRVASCLCFSGCHFERSEEPAPRAQRVRSCLRLVIAYTAGAALGLALPAFYLIPAAYERRFIQTSMALVTNMRIQDNFFFDSTVDHDHNGVNLQISLLGIALLALTVFAVATLVVRHLRSRRSTQTAIALQPGVPAPTLALAALTATLTLMLFPLSLPLWNHIPELSFLQFPWRLLTLVGAILAFTLALLVNPLRTPRTPRLHHGVSEPPHAPTSHLSSLRSTLYPLSSAVLGLFAFHLYTQFCQLNDRPAAIASLLRTHHGFAPTDEYTPLNADSDVLRTQNPAYWLIPATANPNTPAPNTFPTPSELNPALQSDDTPVPPEQAISTPAPMHFTIHTLAPQHLVLNLRDYPAWDITDTDSSATTLYHPPRIPRDDGLMEIPLDHAANHTIDIRWRITLDQQLGLTVSAVALLTLIWLRIQPDRHSPSIPNP